MVKGYAVAITDAGTLPRTARVIQAEFLRQGNKSILSVPIFHDKKLRGLIGFDTTIEHKTWPAATINALYQCANLIGWAKYSNSVNRRGTRLYESTMSPIYLSMRGLTRGIQPESIVGVRSAGNYSEVWLEDGAMVLDSRALGVWLALRSDEHTSELQSLMRISYAVFCLKKKNEQS